MYILLQGTVKFHLTTDPIVGPSANYDFFLIPSFSLLLKSILLGPDNATIPLLCIIITTTFSAPNGMFNETTFTVVKIPHPLFAWF